jgi:deoxyribonuclease-4
VLVGAHVPVTGGLARAPENGRAIGADAIQIFTRNQMQWRARPLEQAEVDAFRASFAASGVRSVLVHGSYLVNLANPGASALQLSRDTFFAEMQRCHALGIPYLVFHPGAHVGTGEDAGLAAVAASLDDLLDRGRGLDVMPLLEVTAGQGSCLGHTFEHLARIFERVREPERLGVCLDTCHLYAAGYDIATPRGYERTFASFETLLGFERLKAFHLNDAKQPLGSRRDRHERVGRGHLGRETFRRLLRDPRFAHLPGVVETPGPIERWRDEVRLLRRLGERTPAPARGGKPTRRPRG